MTRTDLPVEQKSVYWHEASLDPFIAHLSMSLYYQLMFHGQETFSPMVLPQP